MPHVQTKVSREVLANLHRQAIMGGKSLGDLLKEIILNHLKEDVTCLKKQPLKKQQNDPENS